FELSICEGGCDSIPREAASCDAQCRTSVLTRHRLELGTVTAVLFGHVQRAVGTTDELAERRRLAPPAKTGDAETRSDSDDRPRESERLRRELHPRTLDDHRDVR